MSYQYYNQEDGSDMLANTIAFPQAGQTVIVRNRPALVRSVDERTHPSMPAIHEGLFLTFGDTARLLEDVKL
jgi:hypothetical protein